MVREYYANVGKALLRGHAMIQLAYMLMTLSKHRDARAEAKTQSNLFTERYDKFQDVIQNMVNDASRDLWKCNPNPYLDSRKYFIQLK